MRILTAILIVAVFVVPVKADQVDLLATFELGQSYTNWYAIRTNPQLTVEVFQPLNGGYPSRARFAADGERHLSDGNPHSPYGTSKFEVSIVEKRATSSIIAVQWFPLYCLTGPVYELRLNDGVVTISVTNTSAELAAWNTDPETDLWDVLFPGDTKTLSTSELSGQVQYIVVGRERNCSELEWDLPQVWFSSQESVQ